MDGSDMVTMVDIACPVPDCGYKPPANLSDKGQVMALERHIKMQHSINDIPAVADAMAEAEKPQPEPEPEKPAEPPTEPQEPAKAKEAMSVPFREPRTVHPSQDPKPKGLASVAPIDPKKERIAERTEKWADYLYKDFNPLLVSGVSQFAGIPAEWLEGGPINGEPARFQAPDGKVITLWEPTLKKQLELSLGDCKKLAKAGANFAESTMGQAMTMWLESNAHIIALGAALYVAGTYGYRVMKLRAEVGQLKTVLEQQAQMQAPPPAANDGMADVA